MNNICAYKICTYASMRIHSNTYSTTSLYQSTHYEINVLINLKYGNHILNFIRLKKL
jgi:hypothetical protein